MSEKPGRKHHGRVIDTRVRVNATPERAWAAWTDPQEIANWFVDRAEGVAAPGETMTWFFDAFNYRQPVPVVEAEPGKTFVTGSGDQPGPQGLPYLMEITITRERGSTVVRLLNSGFSTDSKFDDEFEGVVSGWKMALATMKYWLEHHDGARRSHVFVMQSASFTWESLRPLFATSVGRQEWIPAAINDASVVLTDTGREVLLSWPDHRAVLGLKAFQMGPRSMIALDLSAWLDGLVIDAGLRNDLQQSLERLKTRLEQPA